MPILDCIDDFFEEVSNFNKSPNKLISGQIAWVPTQILKELPWKMDAERKDSRNHDEIKYNIRNLQANDFQHREGKLPIHRINLQPTEELLLIKAKKRPCILITKTLLDGLSAEEITKLTKGKAHLLQQELIFIPIYSCEDLQSTSGYSQLFASKIRQLLFPHLHYLPASNNSKSKGKFKDSIKEGIIRLDRVFSTIPHHAKISPTNIKISEEYLAVIWSFMSEYFLNKTENELAAFKELCQPQDEVTE